jgi:hypothetical protein
MPALNELFTDSDYYTGPPLDDDMLRRAEGSLGVRLPQSYVDLLFQRNGGSLLRRCLATDFPNSWAGDHIEIRAILGIGGRWGIDVQSANLIAEWEYPNIGVVICDLPSGGHDTVMLDYSKCGPDGDPTVVYVDEDRIPRRIAGSFEDFLSKLESCHESLSSEGN